METTYYKLLQKKDIYRTIIETKTECDLVYAVKCLDLDPEHLTTFDFELKQAVENATTERNSEFGIMSNNYIVVVEKIEE